MPFHPSVLIVGGVFIYAIAALWKLQDRDESNWPGRMTTVLCLALIAVGIITTDI